MAAMERGVVTQQAVVLLYHIRVFANKRLGSPGITKVRGFHRCANVLIANNEILIKTLFQASVLPLANQKSSLSLDAISKLFYYSNLGSYIITSST